MNAANSLDTKSKPMADHRLPEPSMEEILASIRRIIADDESLPGRKDAPAGSLESKAPESKAPELEAPELEALMPSEPDIQATDAHGDPVEQVAEPVLSVGQLVAEDVLQTEAPSRHEDVAIGARAAIGAHDAGSSRALASLDDVVSPAPRLVRPIVLVHEEPVAAPAKIERPLREPRLPPAERMPPSAMGTPVEEAAPVEQEALVLPSDALFSEATHQSVAAAFRTLAATRFADNSEELLDIAREMIRPLLKSWIDNNVPAMVERMVRAEIERVARGGR